MIDELADINDGLKAATLFKYFAQYNNSRIEHKLQLKMVKAKGLYLKHRHKFDKIAKICKTYGIDIEKYFKFIVFEFGKTEKDLDDVLLSRFYMMKFIESLQVISQYNKIYKWFWKSVKYIADECQQLGISDANEYFQHLVTTKQLAAKYMSGKLSAYYLCAIQNLDEIVCKLDKMSQQELSTILHRYEKYNSDVVEAFKLHSSKKLRPIELTNTLIRQRTIQQTTNNNNNK